jgi:hypothetical protein
MKRRDLFPILGTAALPLRAADQPPKFFTAEEYALVGELCDLLLPADGGSGAASAAGVPWYIDRVVGAAREEEQRRWRSGLAAVEEAARKRYRTPMRECTARQKDALMAAMARNEGKPESELERFFALWKPIAIEAYFFSEVGQKEYLGYRGDHAVAAFPGCTHPEHR